MEKDKIAIISLLISLVFGALYLFLDFGHWLLVLIPLLIGWFFKVTS